MAKVVMILGESGDGKTTSIIVPPSGELPDSKSDDILKKIIALKDSGMNSDTTVIVNCDSKELPFPYRQMGYTEGTNLFTSTYDKPITAQYLMGDTVKKTKGLLDLINEGTKVKTVIIDTMNGAMNDKEMLDTRSLSWD